MALASLFSRMASELKRRRVIPVVVSYAVAVFVLLQVAEITFAPLGLPDWALRLVVVLAIVGFPVVAVLAWVFDLTRGGLIRDRATATGRVDDVEVEVESQDGSRTASVAVLPFEDMSSEKDQEFFCDGVAEEILNCLVQIEQLRVASRTSSFQFKGQKCDVGEIARKLHVGAVLEGSVRKSGDRIRVTTQLVNAADGYHLWSDRFDRHLQDIFEIQEEVAANVARALEVTLTAPVREPYATKNVEAYEFFLKGGHYFRRWGQRNVEFAVEMFEKAVEKDPAFARGWAAVADSYAMICMYWEASADNLAGADRASLRALDLAPDLAEAYVSRGLHHVIRDEPDLAKQRFGRALELDSDLFEALYFYGRVLFQQGQLEQAASLFERAEASRPEDFQTPILLRQVYRSLGRSIDAQAAARRGVERAEKHLELNPDDTRALNLGLGGLVHLGDKDRAIEWGERSLALDGDNADTLYNVACGFSLMGEVDRALDCLERACLSGVKIAEWAANDSDLDPLRGNPRFQAVLSELETKRAGLHAEAPEAEG
ncbi:MAG: tetratricopeptide repeat protein [Gemmatimonadota bacterium]|nr:tetratricopeptide repeat protein [Gemmatimonadota bacterium]